MPGFPAAHMDVRMAKYSKSKNSTKRPSVSEHETWPLFTCNLKENTEHVSIKTDLQTICGTGFRRQMQLYTLLQSGIIRWDLFSKCSMTGSSAMVTGP